MLGWTTPKLLAKRVGVVHPKTFAQHLECKFFFPETCRNITTVINQDDKLKNILHGRICLFFKTLDHSPELEDDPTVAVASEGDEGADVVEAEDMLLLPLKL